MARSYRMQKRAAARERTRERILAASMRVHDEKGVAPATFSEIAKEAGVGVATVGRYFPTVGDLVRACGAHVWREMQPPTPDTAAALFADAETIGQRLRHLVRDIDAFYERGAHRLSLAARDRDLVPELAQFLAAVDAGVAATVCEALKPANPTDQTVAVVSALMSFPVWERFRQLDLSPGELFELRISLLEAGITTASQFGS